MSNCKEIEGVRKLIFYVNDNVRYKFPNASVENEVSLIAHDTGSFIIDEIKELPQWSRVTGYSKNYEPNYVDTFIFLLHGIENDVPSILKSMRRNRKGYIVEVQTTSGKSYVFPDPVFLSVDNTKKINSHSWNVELTYRRPTLTDKYTKLNTIPMVYSFIPVGDNAILGTADYFPIVSNK